ncbi:MAG: hypothetical protein FJ291_31305, partial [Planctomycetes bacterium]|nr:hypothetical protein [Planctomycetota bacterium]
TVTTLPGGVENQDFTITYATLAGAADEADIEGDPLSFLVDGVSTGTLTKNGVPVVPNVTLLSAGESLVWRPATDANGTLQAFTVRAWDGHSPSATPVQVSVVVAPSNIPPTLTTVAPLLGGVEDQDYTITYAALAAAANEADPNGDPLSFRVQAVSSGTLTKGGAPVVPGTTLLSAGEDLLWRPALDANGTLQAFTVVAWDGRAPSATPVPVNVEVTPVNDAPSFTEGADQVVNEDAGLQTVAGWATSISPGPADEAGQVVGFLVTNDNNPLFTVQPTVAADGTLTFVSAPDAHGLATVTVKLQDDGGTANGGVDTSAEQTFTVTVNSVNDVPSFAKGPDQTVLPGVGLQTVPGWAANPSPGPANEAGQAVDFLVANDNNALFSIQPAIAPDGSLSYAPATDAHGVATVTVRIHDDGGTANGGVDTSAAQTFTITVNTPPEFQPPFPAGATAEVLVGELFAFDFTATDADPGDPLTFSRIAGPAWLTIDPATGVLSGTPARRPNNLGIFSVTVRVTDGLGGTDDHTFDLGVRGQIITLNAALPKTTFNDSNNNRVSVSLRGPGTVYLVRDFPLGAPFTNATPADLAAIETAGTDVLSSLTVTVKPAKGQLPRTTVGTIVIDNSLGTLAAAPLALTGNASVAGSVVRFTLGDVAAQHLITIRTDLAIPFSSVVLGLVQDASLTSDTPLRLLSIVEWLDTDGTPDVIATPWIASLATRGGKVPGLPAKLAGDFQASLNLRGAPAIPLALMKVAIRGSVLGGDWRIGHDIGGAIRVRGNFTNTSIHAWMLNSLTVGGLITEDLADGDTDVIEVVNGIFWASDAAWGGFIPPDHWFDGVRAYVG